MNRVLLFILLASSALTAYCQEVNEHLRNLENYLQQQGYHVSHTLSNGSGGTINQQWSVALNVVTLGPDVNDSMSEQQKQSLVQTYDSINNLRRQKIVSALDSIRLTFARLGEKSSETYLYEYHKNGVDTIKYSLVFTKNDDSLKIEHPAKHPLMNGPCEAAIFNYHRGHMDDTPDYIENGSYSHFLAIEKNIPHDSMRPFDAVTFSKLIQPSIKKALKLKGAKFYPVYWRHDDGFDDDVEHGLMTKCTYYFANNERVTSHAGLTTGTYYFIPAQYEVEAEQLFKQLKSISYDYVISHPEQPYRYNCSMTYKNSYPWNLLDATVSKDSEVYALIWLCADDGYHMLSLFAKGEMWIPKDFAKIKSYINGEIIYRDK